MGFGWWHSPASPCLGRGPSGGRAAGTSPSRMVPGRHPLGRGEQLRVSPLSRLLRVSRAERGCGGRCVLSMAELIYRQTNTHCYSERRFPSDSFPFF